MPYDRINSYIYNYLCFDKTNRAIMLKGDWGVGKSHYVKNNLISYLNRQSSSIICSLQEICEWIDNEKFEKLDKIQIYQIQMIKDIFRSEIDVSRK